MFNKYRFFYIISSRMRPKELKFPFSWKERKPAFHQGVFIVPQYYSAHASWVDEEGLFSRHPELHIEYCSGNGDWVIEKALAFPFIQWVAVEKQFERVRKIWAKMHNQKVGNLLIVCGEALTFARYYLSNACVAEVFVNFPDPWPKARHAKHRLIQKPFVQELTRIVRPGGKATFATDHQEYSAQMIEKMSDQQVPWTSSFQSPYYTNQWHAYGNSWFQKLWEREGREFYYMQWIRI